jgi:Flp pilus assembly protein TadD
MAARFRARVGENAATLQRHNTTLAEATTASAEALKAYSTGWTLHSTRGAGEAIPSLRHAVELDPEFAMAHAALGRMYADIDESDLSAESLRKAWDLREHASDRERFFIATNYLGLVTGNLEETRKLAKAWVQTYPRDALPHTLLSGLPNKVAGGMKKRHRRLASPSRWIPTSA